MKNSVSLEITDRQKFITIAKEVFRKSIHLCSALIPIMLKFAYAPVIIALAFTVSLYTICELLRLHGKNIPVVSSITAAAARKRDENKFVLGPVTLSLGILASALLWSEQAYSIGIYALAFGDGLASLSGKLFGKVVLPFTQGKTAEGSLTCFTAIFISCFLTSHNTVLSLVIALCGTFIEVLPLKDLDNFIIPIALGAIAQFF